MFIKISVLNISIMLTHTYLLPTWQDTNLPTTYFIGNTLTYLAGHSSTYYLLHRKLTYLLPTWQDTHLPTTCLAGH